MDARDAIKAFGFRELGLKGTIETIDLAAGGVVADTIRVGMVEIWQLRKELIRSVPPGV